MGTWTKQKGYPVLTLTKNQDGTAYRVVQVNIFTRKSKSLLKIKKVLEEISTMHIMISISPLNVVLLVGAFLKQRRSIQQD